MSTKLYDMSDWCKRGAEVENYPYIGEIDIAVSIGDLVKVNNQYYALGITGKGYAGVRQIQLDFEPDDERFEGNIKCPYCGYEDRDSWEEEDSDDNHECERCGGIFEYERVVTVEYNSTPKKPPEVINAEWI